MSKENRRLPKCPSVKTDDENDQLVAILKVDESGNYKTVTAVDRNETKNKKDHDCGIDY